MAGYKGHLMGGIVMGLTTSYIMSVKGINFNGLGETTIWAGSLLIGSLLPDIDHPKSILGHRVPFISKPLYKWVGHRTFTHSIFMLIIISIVASLYNQQAIGIGISLGILSHIILDLLGFGSGVAFLYPLYKKRIKIWR